MIKYLIQKLQEYYMDIIDNKHNGWIKLLNIKINYNLINLKYILFNIN